MSNESIAAIPPDVTQPEVLRRFLLRLVEELDLVLGFRGNDALVRQSELTAAGTATIDTLGEVTVLAVAAIGVFALMKLRAEE